MEYNLLKTIEPNLGLRMCPSQNPRLTPYPAVDYVNPGLGQAARVFSFYVPLHTNQSPYTIEKKEDEAMSQEGGSQESVSKDSNPTTFNDASDDIDNIDPIEFNARKRKLMGDGIQSSFMHPKIVTGTIELEPQSKVKKKNLTVKSEENGNKTGKGQHVKHKFQFH
jgi:hypothetical protein